jgi:integrase
VQYWTRGEVERLIALARKHEPRFAPLLVLLFSTGLRRGEALGLHWSDVDFDSRVLTVRRSITKEGVGTPKSGKARRVPMTPALAEISSTSWVPDAAKRSRTAGRKFPSGFSAPNPAVGRRRAPRRRRGARCSVAADQTRATPSAPGSGCGDARRRTVSAR